MVIFHGTTDKFLPEINSVGIRPGSYKTEKRKCNLDKVFFTNVYKHARAYAIRATMKFGGNPIIFHVRYEHMNFPANNQIMLDGVLTCDIIRVDKLANFCEREAWENFQ